MSGSGASSEPDHASRLSSAYAAAGGGAPAEAPSTLDELIGPEGRPHGHAADLAATVDLIGLQGLLTRRAEAQRLVEDEGVTYGNDLTGGGASRRWQLDPLPVVLDPADWSRLEAGLAQRARLLDAVALDLYGPRTLLHRGVIPAEVVLGHPGFVREADQVVLPGGHQLLLTATDLVRVRDGGWHVVADRTASPSGAGYAIQARRVVGRVLPGLYRDTRLHRLRSFFDALRLALQEVAPSTAEAPRVVLLIPGPSTHTPFDHAFLATLLGYPLVTAEDLTVRAGRVYLRSLGRLEPVDVVLRRLSDADADPLELRADSELGVPGLLEAARRGAVSVVNPIGSGLLESPGLAPYLPAAARALLGEELILAAPRSWWCGDEGSLRHVLAHLEALVLHPVVRPVRGTGVVHGPTLSQAALADLRVRIEAAPRAWCAQEVLEISTTPIITSRGLLPRRFTLRGFAVGHRGEYRVLTGGLGRIAGEVGNEAASNSALAPAKDVWVPVAHDAVTEQSGAVELAWPRGGAALRSGTASAASVLPPRAAENLFRLGRFAERAEDTVRLLRVVDDLAEDWTARPGTPGAVALEVLRTALPTGRGTDPDLFALVTDPRLPDSLAASVHATLDAAHVVREQLSLDTWIVLGSLERVLAETAGSTPGRDVPLAPVLARVLEGLLALAGLGAESMVRDLGWAFMDAGRRLERAGQLLGVLRRTLDVVHPAPVQAMVLEAVLVVGESIITHRRRHPDRPGAVRVADVLELLLLDRGNPRAVALQLDRLLEDLSAIPDRAGPDGDPAPLQTRARTAAARLRELDLQALSRGEDGGRRTELVRALDALRADLDDLAGRLQATHFGHLTPHRATAAISGWNE